MCRRPLTNIADESVPCLPCSLRSSVHSPRGQAAETGPHGSRSHQLRHHSLCQAAPCAAPGPREAAPEAGSAGETPGCPRVGRVRRVWGAAACPSAQDTPLPRAPRPCPRGQARAGDPGSASSRSRSGKRAPGPLSVTSRSSLHPHLHWEPRCVYVLMSCASIRWQLSRGCFPSGTEL